MITSQTGVEGTVTLLVYLMWLKLRRFDGESDALTGASSLRRSCPTQLIKMLSLFFATPRSTEELNILEDSLTTLS